MLAPGTRESQGLGCHVESFFYEDSSRGGDLWHWCCVQLAPGMWTYDGRDSDPMTVSMPWEAVGRIFWNWHHFQNTSQNGKIYELPKWHPRDTSGCRCRSSWRVLATILLTCCAMDSCFIVTWSLQHPKSLQWIVNHTNVEGAWSVYQSLWISKILAPFVSLCGLWCLLVRGIVREQQEKWESQKGYHDVTMYH